uniref:Uncharacterized protein n=1 Tax=Ditylenchus dipsaci TaxID=166011 RepID=A0A915D9L1_9BILA
MPRGGAGPLRTLKNQPTIKRQQFRPMPMSNNVNQQKQQQQSIPANNNNNSQPAGQSCSPPQLVQESIQKEVNSKEMAKEIVEMAPTPQQQVLE